MKRRLAPRVRQSIFHRRGAPSSQRSPFPFSALAACRHVTVHTTPPARAASAQIRLTFASLPLPLAQLIFLALPVDARARASCVCRAWRDVLAESALWTRLDLSKSSGVEWPRRESVALLRGAAARARGLLYRLGFSGTEHTFETLLEVLAANAGSLRELRVDSLSGDLAAKVEALVAAAPLLQVVEADCVWCMWEEAPRVMRAEPPFTPLRLVSSTINVFFVDNDEPRGMERVGPFAAALADVTLQPALSGVHLLDLDTAQRAVMGALVDAALARALREFTLESCTPPAAAPLARLLAEGSLTDLCIMSTDADTPLLDAAGAALVAGALRLNTTLTSLELYYAGLCRDMDAACTLLAAFVGHPSLRELELSEGPDSDELGGALAGALAALVAADAPALEELNCSDNALGDADLAPIVEALACNNHLHTLDISRNDASDPFKRVLRALLAKHASLRELQL